MLIDLSDTAPENVPNSNNEDTKLNGERIKPGIDSEKIFCTIDFKITSCSSLDYTDDIVGNITILGVRDVWVFFVHVLETLKINSNSLSINNE